MSNKERPTRRAALLGDRPGSYAIARHVRMSPTKVRRVVDVVRGLAVTDALAVLKFAPQAASDPVYKVVASAAANAEQTENLRSEQLYISRETVLDHVRRIRAKYAAMDRPARTKVDLYRRAVEDGIIVGDD